MFSKILDLYLLDASGMPSGYDNNNNNKNSSRHYQMSPWGQITPILDPSDVDFNDQFQILVKMEKESRVCQTKVGGVRNAPFQRI